MEYTMTKGTSNSQASQEPLTLQQQFALAQATMPCNVLTYEREREQAGKEILNAFVYEDRAWLYYWQTDEYDGYEEGFRSDDPSYTGEADALYPYMLDNGQVDEYPCSWTIPIDEAIRAVEYFLNGGTMAPWVHWLDDENWN